MDKTLLAERFPDAFEVEREGKRLAFVFPNEEDAQRAYWLVHNALDLGIKVVIQRLP